MAAIACDALWPKTRLKQAGLTTDDLCPLCLAHPDTLHHRAWICSHSEHIRRKHATTLQVREAQANPMSALWTFGWLPRPQRVWPSPAPYLTTASSTGRWRVGGCTAARPRPPGGRLRSLRNLRLLAPRLSLPMAHLCWCRIVLLSFSSLRFPSSRPCTTGGNGHTRGGIPVGTPLRYPPWSAW